MGYLGGGLLLLGGDRSFGPGGYGGRPVEACLPLSSDPGERGLLVGKGGLYGNVLRVAPPLSLTEAEADEFNASSVSGDVIVNKLKASGFDAQSVSADLRLTDRGPRGGPALGIGLGVAFRPGTPRFHDVARGQPAVIGRHTLRQGEDRQQGEEQDMGQVRLQCRPPARQGV